MNKKLLTLSIVIPVYEEEDHLKACLDSVKNQTVAPDEVIVVDNSSSDKTVEIAKSYPFVTLLKEKRQGIVYARDKGFDAVTSGIIGRIDGDTVLPKNWVAKVKKYYAEDNDTFALTGGGYFYNVRFPRFNGWVLSQLAYRLNRLIVGHYILWGSNMAITRLQWRSVKDAVCINDEVHEDLDLAIHLHRQGYRIHYRSDIRVGVYLKRVWEDREKQNEHLARWPHTLRSHGFPLWWLSISGNILLKYVGQPFVFLTEYGARIFGRKHETTK